VQQGNQQGEVLIGGRPVAQYRGDPRAQLRHRPRIAGGARS
jgi:hypothetical protein